MQMKKVKSLRNGDQVYIRSTNGDLQLIIIDQSQIVEGGLVEIKTNSGRMITCHPQTLVAGPVVNKPVPVNALWRNDKVQFARLLCELVANWHDDKEAKITIRAVANAMDLNDDDINDLFDRANDVWEKAKSKV